MESNERAELERELAESRLENPEPDPDRQYDEANSGAVVLPVPDAAQEAA